MTNSFRRSFREFPLRTTRADNAESAGRATSCLLRATIGTRTTSHAAASATMINELGISLTPGLHFCHHVNHIGTRNHAGAPGKRAKCVTRSGKIHCRRQTSHPPDVASRKHPIDETLVELLAGQCVTQMIAPITGDVEITSEQALLAEAGLVQHPNARAVLRPHRRLQPVKPARAERVIHGERDCPCRHTTTCQLGRHPVTHPRGSQRRTDHVAERELPDEHPVDQDAERQTLATACQPAQRRPLRRPGQRHVPIVPTAYARRFPLLEILTITDTDPTPRPRVPQSHRTQRQRPRAWGTRGRGVGSDSTPTRPPVAPDAAPASPRERRAARAWRATQDAVARATRIPTTPVAATRLPTRAVRRG